MDNRQIVSSLGNSGRVVVSIETAHKWVRFVVSVDVTEGPVSDQMVDEVTSAAWAMTAAVEAQREEDNGDG